MKTLVTGATGLIGNAIAKKLIEAGHSVRALVRDLGRAESMLPAQVERVQGDILEPASLEAAFAGGLDWVFHAAGMPEQWHPDDRIFDRINREGTRHMLTAARSKGVKRFILTSTMDVFAAPRGGIVVETAIEQRPKPTAYERSKQAAEREADAARALGLDVVFVNPSATYGPSPVVGGLNAFFIKLVHRKMPLLPPGGMSLVYIDGLAAAHVVAAECGRSGERYLVSDTHVTTTQFAREIARQAGLKKVPATAPEALMRLVVGVSTPLARVLHFKPDIAPGELEFVLWNAGADASKAKRELGFQPLSLTEGVERTLAFLRAEGLIP